MKLSTISLILLFFISIEVKAQMLTTDPRTVPPPPPNSFNELSTRFMPNMNFQDPNSLSLAYHETSSLSLSVIDGVCYGVAAFSEEINELRLYIYEHGELVAQGPTQADNYPNTSWCSNGEVEIRLIAYDGEGVVVVGTASEPISEYWANGTGSELENRIARLIARSAPNFMPITVLQIASFQQPASQIISISLEAGFCYAMLAVGEPTVVDLDLMFLSENDELLDQDFENDPTAVVSHCPEQDGMYRVRIALIAGYGQIATQLLRLELHDR